MKRWNGSSYTLPSSRWNPKEEQILILEGLYKEGIRRPSSEQIDEITMKLRAFGSIEAKSVFYWFQNHKARLRQKQIKQERFLPRLPPTNILAAAAPPPTASSLQLLPPSQACINVNCSTYYSPELAQFGGGSGFYQPDHEFPTVFIPAGDNFQRRLHIDGLIHKGYANYNSTEDFIREAHEINYKPSHDHCSNAAYTIVNGGNDQNRETLQLFPLHPTAVLPARGAPRTASIGLDRI